MKTRKNGNIHTPGINIIGKVISENRGHKGKLKILITLQPSDYTEDTHTEADFVHQVCA